LPTNVTPPQETTLNDTSAAPARAPGLLHAVAAACALAALHTSAHAVNIEFDNPDVKARWDTTLGYSLGVRVAKPDAVLTQGPGALNFNDGDLNFGKRKRPIANRLDLFTEADVSWQGFGARLSAAAWYDAAYERSNSNTSALVAFPPPQPFNPSRTLNGGAPGEFTSATKDQHGSKAEMLDAFVFGKFDLGSMPLNVRLGQHALLWGESLFFGANAIAAGMAPIDIAKAQASPNSTIKEIVRPVGQLSAQMQITPDVSIGGYLQYEWEKSRLPASGSYYSTNDTIDVGGQRLYVGPPAFPVVFAVPRGRDKPAPDSGQGGVQLRFRLPITEADFGLYAIQYHNKLPVAYLNFAPAGPAAAASNYRLVYPEKIKALGASFNTTFGVVNLGGEASVRSNAPLTRGLVALGGIGSPPGAANASDNPAYPVGRTAHINLSTITTVPSFAFARESSLAAEVAWNRVLSCRKNCASIPGAVIPGVGPVPGFTPRDGNAERDAWGFRLVYTPVYRQALDGIDLSVPVGLSYSPKGKSGAVGPLMVDKGGDVSIGLSANVNALYTVALNYTHYYGKVATANDAAGFFSFGQTLKDRDNVTLSARVSF
jgi:Protein of unknown function (DUF1302)